MIYELNHFGIVVSDLDKSLTFYRDLLGARVVFEGHIPATNTAVRYLQISGGMIELLHRPDAPSDETVGVTHVAFLTDSLEADFDRAVAAGAKPLTQPRPAGSGVGRLAFVQDPNGAKVELLERDLVMRGEPIPHEFVRSFDHYSVAVKDLDAAVRFYGPLFGMKELHRVDDSGSAIEYLHYDYDVLELIHRPAQQEGNVFAHIALRVDSVDQALDACAARGVPAESGTPRPARHGSGKVGIIRDPDSVVIEFLDRPDLRAL